MFLFILKLLIMAKKREVPFMTIKDLEQVPPIGEKGKEPVFLENLTSGKTPKTRKEKPAGSSQKTLWHLAVSDRVRRFLNYEKFRILATEGRNVSYSDIIESYLKHSKDFEKFE